MSGAPTCRGWASRLDPVALVRPFPNRLGPRLPRKFLDSERAQLFRLFESFACFLDHFVGQVLAGVMPFRIDGGVQPLLG
ncbi:hypothetical protein ASD68_16135 [Rhodanobacter sp. Root627]|nr:hypothetical protein ASD68_16135 [Rhodanobacter sp. Root627]